MIKRVGFIGLGAMGLPMAECIAKSGVSLWGYDINMTPVRILAENYTNVYAAETLAEVGQNCNIVITMLPDAKTVAEICEGETGLFAAMETGSVWIDMTTGDPFVTERLSALAELRGIRCMDSPCGRSPKHAKEGALLLLVGGEKTLLEEMRPLLDLMASNIIRCGNLGAGHTMKLINNLLSGVIQEANVEAISLGVRAGIDISTMLQVFSNVCVWNGYLAALPYEEEGAPGWKVTIAEEHMELVEKLGRRYRVPIYTPAVVRARMNEMIAEGKGETKYSNITTLMKNMAGIEIKEKITGPTVREQ